VPVLVDFGRLVRTALRDRAAPRRARGVRGQSQGEEDQRDDHQAVAQRYRVSSIPNLIVFKNGQVAQQIVGAVPKSRLSQALDTVIV
jgi:thioredoxin 1